MGLPLIQRSLNDKVHRGLLVVLDNALALAFSPEVDPPVPGADRVPIEALPKSH